MHHLDGCRAKIQRARSHVIEFAEGVRAFTDHAPYKVCGQHDLAANELVFAAEADPEFACIPLGLPLLAGEVAHQLRSALDHLVWQLVVANTGQGPQGTKSSFPIFLTEAGYIGRAPAMIAGVSAEAQTRIQAAQPYHAGGDAECTLTWVVHELNNTDKHRVIPITTTYSFVGHVRMRKLDGRQVDIVPPKDEVREPLHDGMEIARVPVTDGMDGAKFDIPIGFDVAFEQLGGVRRQPATSLLTEATDYVRDLAESLGDG